MGSPQQTAHCPVCGTRALVDPKTRKVRSHLRKGGVTCEGRVERPTGLARLVPQFVRRRRTASASASASAPASAPAADAVEAAGATGTGEPADGTASPARIRVDCPVCGRFSAVDPQDIRIRLHKGGSGRKCLGSGTFPEVGALTIEGLDVVEVRQRRRDAMAKRRPTAGEEKKSRALRLPGRKQGAGS